MEQNDDEERLLRSVALQNAKSILLARQRAEEELVRAKEALELKTQELAHSLVMMAQSKQRFRSLVAATTSIAWTVDEVGRFVTEQPSWAAYTGQTWDEYRDFGWADALHLDDQDRVRSLWEAARSSGTVYDSDGRLWHAASGTYRHFEARGVPVRNADGSVREWVGMCVEVEDRKRAEAAEREGERRFHFMAESMPQKIFTANPNGDVDYFNPQWTEFTGLSFEQIRDWGWMQFIHPDDVADNVRVWQHSTDTGEPFQFEHRFRRADGESRWHLSRALPMRDERGRLSCGSARTPTFTSKCKWRMNCGSSPPICPRLTAARTSSWRCLPTSCATPWPPSAMPCKSYS